MMPLVEKGHPWKVEGTSTMGAQKNKPNHCGTPRSKSSDDHMGQGGKEKGSSWGTGIKARLGTGGSAEPKAGVPGIAQQGQSVRGPWPQSTSHF